VRESSQGTATTNKSIATPIAVPKSLPKVMEYDDELVMKCVTQQIGTASKLVMSVFDFGGQSVFNVIHHLFLTRYGVYVLVFDMQSLLSEVTRNSAIDTLQFWMNSVVVHTKDQHDDTIAPILLVGTRKDQVSSAADHQTISNLLYSTFRSHVGWGHVLEYEEGCGAKGRTTLAYFHVDNTKGRGDPTVVHMMQTIEDVISKSAYVKALKPLVWLQCLDKLYETKKSYMHLDEATSIMGTCGLQSDDVLDALRFFNNMGMLLWHEEEGLRNTVIIDAIKFFVTPAKTVICKHATDTRDDDSTRHVLPIHKTAQKKHYQDWLNMVDRGVVTSVLLGTQLTDYSDTYAILLQLMVLYGLIVPLLHLCANLELYLDDLAVSDADGGLTDVTTYLVPALLPMAPAEVSHGKWSDRSFNSCLFFFATSDIPDDLLALCLDECRKFGFLPRGVFERVIAMIVTWCQAGGANISSHIIYKDYALFP
jgi:hypothetical protein